MIDLIDAALKYTGGEPCTDDKSQLKKARDTLISAKKHWLSMDYGVIEKFAGRDLGASLIGMVQLSALERKTLMFALAIQ